MSLYRHDRFRPILPHDTPGTNFIILSNAITFILLFLRILPDQVYLLLVSTSSTVFATPWTLFTYPLVAIPGGGMAFLTLLITLWWLYFVGGILERTWGTKRFLSVFFAFSALSAFFLTLGARLLNLETSFDGLYCPLVNLTVIWSVLEPTTPVVLLVFPMQLRWLALITCLMLFFEFGSPSPLMGAIALMSPAGAALYARSLLGYRPLRRFRSYPGKPRSTTRWISYLNPFDWYRRWQFKRRFRKLWGDK